MFVRYQQVSRIVDLVKPASIVEVGTWNGDHALIMARQALRWQPRVHYRGFDLFEDATAASDAEELNVRTHHALSAVTAKLDAFRAENPGFSFELVRGDTRNTLSNIAADFAYIDGGHSVATIASDFAHLKTCAAVVLDDYYAFDELGRRPDVAAVGCNRSIDSIPHVLLPAFDALAAGGRIMMAATGSAILERLDLRRPAAVPGGKRRAVVTTFAMNGYYDYGKRFLETFAQFWPEDVDLHVYVEGPLPALPDARIRAVNMLRACPDMVGFKLRHANDPKANGIIGPGQDDYRFNAVKFCHKVFALTHAACNLDADVLYWIDADSLSFRPVTHEFLDSLLPDGAYTAYLGRRNMHSECGFMAFDLRHAQNRNFMELWRSIYADDRVFDLPEWHDSYVYDQVRRTFETEAGLMTRDLRAGLSDDHHPFVNSPLGDYMDHMIGPRRKTSGCSYALDLRQPRKSVYWQMVPWAPEELAALAAQTSRPGPS